MTTHACCCCCSLLLYSYMTDAVGYLMSSLKKDRERSAAFRAVGQMVLVLKDRMDLAPVILTVKNNLPRQDIGTR